ncbi:hypothetical protein ACHAPU_002840, partial [Fusarium lateritium]
DCQADAFQYGGNGLEDRYQKPNVAPVSRVNDEAESDLFVNRLSLPHDRTFIYNRSYPDSDGTPARANAPSNEPSTISSTGAHAMFIETPRLEEGNSFLSYETNTSLLDKPTAPPSTTLKRSRSDDELRANEASHYQGSERAVVPSTEEEESQPIRERNRQAAMRFRSRQRDSVAKLQSVEQAVEKRHHELCESVNILNKEIMCLKMQVLQHIECGCVTVHRSAEQEDQQYI